MSVFDREMFRQTSIYSPDVTVTSPRLDPPVERPEEIGVQPETGGGSSGIETLVPENIAIVPDINFDELPKQIDPNNLGNINQGATLGPNDFALSDGRIVDGTSLIAQINDGSISTNLINRLSTQANREVPMGENIINAIARYYARSGEGAQRREPMLIDSDLQTIEAVKRRLGTQYAPQTAGGDFVSGLENVGGGLRSILDFGKDIFGYGGTEEDKKERDEFYKDQKRLGTTIYDLGTDAQGLQKVLDATQDALKKYDPTYTENIATPEIVTDIDGSSGVPEEDIKIPEEGVTPEKSPEEIAKEEEAERRRRLEEAIAEGQENPLPSPEDRSPPGEADFVVSKEDQEKYVKDDRNFIFSQAALGAFGDGKLRDLMSEIGQGLVQTGSFMGIPLGTMTFAKKQADKRTASSEQAFELLKEQAKNAGKSGLELKPSDFLKVSNEIQEEVPFLEGNIQAVRLLEKAIDIVDKNPSRATGFRGLIESAFSDVRAALGKGTLDFDSLPPYKQVATIIETIRQKNLQAVLGESGRTISDRDRQIITKVFGDQRSGFASPGELKKLLRQSLAGFKESGKAYQISIKGNLAMVKSDPRYSTQAEAYYAPKFDKYNLDYDSLVSEIGRTTDVLENKIFLGKLK